MHSSSDEESSEDFDERIKNVRSLLIRSFSGSRSEVNTDYVFKRKLGDLIFDANFEGGNLGSVEQRDKFTYDLKIRPDIANPNFRLWFNFNVFNQRPGQCVIFSIVNLSESIDLFNEGLTPVVRSRMYPNWVHLQQDQVFYYRSHEHNNKHVLSIAFKFNSTSTRNDEHQFALSYPYTITRLIQFVNRWIVELERCLKRSPLTRSSSCSHETRECEHKESRARLEVNILTESTLSKPIYKLSVREIQRTFSEVSEQSKLKVIVVGGWSGNFDSATHLICQGLVDFMLSDNVVARALLRHIDLFVFPMPDPDSSWVGNSRSDIFGQVNPNQKLVQANPRLYKNISSITDELIKLCESKNRIILLDLETNPSLIGSRVIGSKYEDTFRMERHLFLPRLLSRFIDGFSLEECLFTRDGQLENKPTFTVHLHRDNVDQYRLEISLFASYKRSLHSGSYVVYDQIKYLSLGKSISYALLEMIKNY